MATDPEKGIKSGYEHEEVEVNGLSTPSRAESLQRRPDSGPGSAVVGSSRSQISSTLTIKPAWALHHHKPNLITEIRKPEPILKKTKINLQRWIKSLCGCPFEDHQRSSETVQTASAKWEDRRFRLSLAELQRMQLRKLQIKLVGDVVNMHYSNKESENEESENTLRQYGEYYPSNGTVYIVLIAQSI